MDRSELQDFVHGAIERHPCPHCGSLSTPTVADVRGKEKWLICASCEGWATEEVWGISADELACSDGVQEEIEALQEEPFSCRECGASDFDPAPDYVCPDCGSEVIEPSEYRN